MDAGAEPLLRWASCAPALTLARFVGFGSLFSSTTRPSRAWRWRKRGSCAAAASRSSGDDGADGVDGLDDEQDAGSCTASFVFAAPVNRFSSLLRAARSAVFKGLHFFLPRFAVFGCFALPPSATAPAAAAAAAAAALAALVVVDDDVDDDDDADAADVWYCPTRLGCLHAACSAASNSEPWSA